MLLTGVIRAPLCGRAIVISPSVHPSVSPSKITCPRHMFSPLGPVSMMSSIKQVLIKLANMSSLVFLMLCSFNLELWCFQMSINQSFSCADQEFFSRGWNYLSFPVGGRGLRHIFGNFILNINFKKFEIWEGVSGPPSRSAHGSINLI